MKFLKFILAISCSLHMCCEKAMACGPYYPANPNSIKIFRVCSPNLQLQWHEGCRSHAYEQEQNCILWQQITSPDIPLKDIENIVYTSTLSEIAHELPAGNMFAQWLDRTENAEDKDYLMIAKEIEEIRKEMNNPWYYSFEGDEEHVRLRELQNICEAYSGQRHAARYALQLVRLHFALGEFNDCIEIWETSVKDLPNDIITDMIASYVGGAYYRSGNREKALELYTLSQDIGSLMNLKAWNDEEEISEFTDKRVRELEFIFNRFPNSPLLSIKLQDYVRNRERYSEESEVLKNNAFCAPAISFVAESDKIFYDELKRFALRASTAKSCSQKGMWHYALAYLSYLDGNLGEASRQLRYAEKSPNSVLINESIRAFRFLVDATMARGSSFNTSGLLKDLKWLDGNIERDLAMKDGGDGDWQYDNKLNWSFYYWQDVARKVILGVICPKMINSGRVPEALQLANYASNRIHQLAPLYRAYHTFRNENGKRESIAKTISFDELRQSWPGNNNFDYSNQFFTIINNVSADEAAKYASRIAKPLSQFDRFLNERSYIDTDYICDIIGTLYLREMNYSEAEKWLSKVSTRYQQRTNIAKDGYFRLDPFRMQFDTNHFIADSSDYKLRFAQEMLRLDRLINSDCEANRKANAKIRYATGLRNSFGLCWYLTAYSYNFLYTSGPEPDEWHCYSSANREGFRGNRHAQKAYRCVDKLMAEALSEFTDPEQAAETNREMMNFATLMKLYPDTEAAAHIRGRCDNYHDYALHKR